MKRFNQCVEVADIIKFSDQRIKDVEQFESYKDKLFIQTQGSLQAYSMSMGRVWVRGE